MNTRAHSRLEHPPSSVMVLAVQGGEGGCERLRIWLCFPANQEEGWRVYMIMYEGIGRRGEPDHACYRLVFVINYMTS